MHGYLRHLANFFHVVDAGSITAAANRLGNSPSSISESIKVLEAQVGEALLERRRSGVIPTGRGTSIFQESQVIVASLDRALGETSNDDTQTLRISVPSELANGWFETALAKIAKQAPDLTLVMMIEDALVDHTKYARDIHIRAGSSEPRSGMTTLYTGATRAIMVAATEIIAGIDTKVPDELCQLPFVGKPRANRNVAIRLSTGKQIVFDRSLQVSAITTRIALARQGLGITTCLRHTVLSDLKTKRLTQLLPKEFNYPVHIAIASPHKRPPKIAKWVAERLGESLPQA